MTMSVSIQSPLLSDVVSCLESLSPPPTPIAKRARHFFPSNAATPTPPTPMFFPKSQSLLRANDISKPSRPSTVDRETVRKKQLAMLAARPAPRLRLKPNIRAPLADASHKENINYKMDIDQVPPLPFSFPPLLPSLSVSFCESPPSMSSSSGIRSEPTPKKSDPTPAVPDEKLPSFRRNGMHRGFVKCNSFAAGPHAKLPAFQRNGMRRGFVKCNSFAARSA
ncbi:hypothetical protein ACHAWF_005840 [Thalassiosira exigua]